MNDFQGLLLNKHPETWPISWPEKDDKISETYGMPVLKVTYGQILNRQEAKSEKAECYMRESVYAALCDGTFTVVAQDNAFGMLIIDRKTKLSVPLVTVRVPCFDSAEMFCDIYIEAF